MDPHSGAIRWGIAGTGGIAASFVKDFANLDAGENAEIVAVGSRSGDSATTFADAHGIGRAHESYEALAADPDVDAIYVAGIHTVHAPQSVMFLDAGKHVLVEKPMALNAAQIDEMTAAAARNDRFLMEAMWMRFNPAHIEMIERIRAGVIGDVRRVHADFSFPLPYTPDHRLWAREKGGGALLDLGIYPLALAWWVLGPPATIAVAGTVAHGVDESVSMLCEWDDGATATLTTGFTVSGSLAGRIEGTGGTIDLPPPAHATNRMTIQTPAGVEELEADPAGLRHQVTEVHRCVRAGARESPQLPWATSRAIIERFDTIRAELGVRYDVD